MFYCVGLRFILPVPLTFVCSRHIPFISLPLWYLSHPLSYAIADEDMARENEEKTSAVHFLRFELDATSVAAAKAGSPIRMGIDHEAYKVEPIALAENTRSALVLDLS